MVLTLAATIFVLGILVLAHELGHFITAKMTGMRVDEFAIGFGPKIFAVKRGETVYSIRAIPLGGYNSIAGLAPGDTDAGDRSYAAKPIKSRMLVILAGSGMNLILPIFLFFAVFLASGVQVMNPDPVVGSVMEGMPAEEAGLQKGDRVLAVDGKPVTSWVDFTSTLKTVGENPVTLEIDRGGETVTASMTPRYNADEKRLLIGVTNQTDTTYPGVFESAVLAVKQTGNIIQMMIEGIYNIFLQMSGQELAGPIGIAQLTGQVAEHGFIPLLRFMAFLSLNLGIVNLLPIPMLDGGHFVTLCLEAVRGKPLGPKALETVQTVGIVLLLLLMLLATKNDIVRVLSGG